MSTVARAIYRAIDELYQNCDTIKNSNEGCEVCPLNTYCIEDTTLMGMALDVPYERIDDFIETANEVTGYSPYDSKEAWEDYQANEARQDDAVYGD